MTNKLDAKVLIRDSLRFVLCLFTGFLCDQLKLANAYSIFILAESEPLLFLQRISDAQRLKNLDLSDHGRRSCLDRFSADPSRCIHVDPIH